MYAGTATASVPSGPDVIVHCGLSGTEDKDSRIQHLNISLDGVVLSV